MPHIAILVKNVFASSSNNRNDCIFLQNFDFSSFFKASHYMNSGLGLNFWIRKYFCCNFNRVFILCFQVIGRFFIWFWSVFSWFNEKKTPIYLFLAWYCSYARFAWFAHTFSRRDKGPRSWKNQLVRHKVMKVECQTYNIGSIP
jgi:hypothetical protein